MTARVDSCDDLLSDIAALFHRDMRWTEVGFQRDVRLIHIHAILRNARFNA